MSWDDFWAEEPEPLREFPGAAYDDWLAAPYEDERWRGPPSRDEEHDPNAELRADPALWEALAWLEPMLWARRK